MFSINTNDSREFSNGFIAKIIYTVTFLLPVFFLPYTFDIFKLNKSYLVITTVALSVILFLLNAWVAKVLLYKNFSNYLAPAMLLAAAFVSMQFSTNKMVSLWGQSESYNDTFIFYSALAVLFIVIVNLKLNFYRALTLIATGSTIAVMYGWYLLYRPFDLAGMRFLAGSSTADSWSALVALSVMSAFVFSFYVFNTNINKESSNFFKKAIFALMLVVNLSFLITVREFLALGFLAIALVCSNYLGRISFKIHYFIVGLVLVVSLSIGGTHYVPGFTSRIGFTFPQVQRVSIYDSWYIANSVLLEKPFTGFGIANFSTAYTLYKPVTANMSESWNLVFFQPFNDMFAWLTMGGLVGFSLYVGFFALPLIRAFRYLHSGGMHILPSLVLILCAGLLLIYGNNTALLFLFVVTAAYLTSVSSNIVHEAHSRNLVLLSLVVSFGLAGYLFVNMYSVYVANYMFRASLFEKNPLNAYSKQVAAISAYPYETKFVRETALNGISIAASVSQNKDLTDEQKKLLEDLIVQSARYATVSTEVLGSNISANWETRAILYKSLISLDKEKYLNPAIQSYVNAINLDKFNPRLKTDLAIILYGQKEYQGASNMLSQAIKDKSDYPNSYYVMSKVLRDTKDYPNAFIYIDAVKKLIPTDDPNYATISTEYDELKGLAEKAQKEAAANADKSSNGLSIPDVNVDEKDKKQNLDVSNGSNVSVNKTSVEAPLNSVPDKVPEVTGDNSSGVETK
ncbi:MAG: hypothetical protein E6Q58_01640 [Niabella sp.]|nr:MAG: hypothetical protein E6Q58_01640 [Niabella sp.]